MAKYIESNARREILDKLNLIFDEMTNIKYKYLSKSPHLRYSDVAANKTADWDWYKLSKNPSITLQDILSHPDHPWKWERDKWLFGCVSMNPGIQFQDILQHLDKPWDWSELSENETVTMDIVLAHLDRPWSWRRLSMNPGILWSDIQAHPDLPWEYETLSQRPISSEQIIIILDNFAKWDWYYLSIMASFELIQNNPDWPWRWRGMCLNVNVPFMFIPEKYRDYRNLSYNHNTSIQDVLDHPTARWCWSGLSEMIDFKDILRHLELPWEFRPMSKNPGLRLDYVMKHISEPWDVSWLAKNSFSDDYTRPMRQHLAALKIQLYWRKYASDHRYLLCHRVQLYRNMKI